MILYLHIKSLLFFSQCAQRVLWAPGVQLNGVKSSNESYMMSNTLWRFTIPLWHILVLNFLFRADDITQLPTQTTQGLHVFLKSITSKGADCWAANTMLRQKSLQWAGRCFINHSCSQVLSDWLSFSRFIPAVVFCLVSTGLFVIRWAKFEPISAYRLSQLSPLNKSLWYFERFRLPRTSRFLEYGKFRSILAGIRGNHDPDMHYIALYVCLNILRSKELVNIRVVLMKFSRKGEI